MKSHTRWFSLIVVVFASSTMAPGRCGGSAAGFFADTPAPDVQGTWNLTYENDVHVEVEVAGQTYTGSIGGTAGSVSFTHEGEEYVFELDCEAPGVLCPSEIFPARAQLEQRRFEENPHQVHMPTYESTCTGETRMPDEAAGECGGEGEDEIPCDQPICEGTLIEQETVSVGSINDPDAEVGDTPAYTISIGLRAAFGGFATPYGVCVGGTASHAEADIEYTGTYDPDSNNMAATRLANGEVVLTFGGACLIALAGGGNAGAGMASAKITIWTNFTATKALIDR